MISFNQKILSFLLLFNPSLYGMQRTVIKALSQHPVLPTSFYQKKAAKIFFQAPPSWLEKNKPIYKSYLTTLIINLKKPTVPARFYDVPEYTLLKVCDPLSANDRFIAPENSMLKSDEFRINFFNEACRTTRAAFKKVIGCDIERPQFEKFLVYDEIELSEVKNLPEVSEDEYWKRLNAAYGKNGEWVAYVLETIRLARVIEETINQKEFIDHE